MARVVDTDVVSYLFRGDSRAELYRSHLGGELLVVSFMTVAELDRWALERGWGETRKERMERHIGHFVVYPYNRLPLQPSALSHVGGGLGRSAPEREARGGG